MTNAGYAQSLIDRIDAAGGPPRHLAAKFAVARSQVAAGELGYGSSDLGGAFLLIPFLIGILKIMGLGAVAYVGWSVVPEAIEAASAMTTTTGIAVQTVTWLGVGWLAYQMWKGR